MSFAPLQRDVDAWIQTHTPGCFSPLQMLARLTEELGELSRAVSHHHGEKTPKPGEEKGSVEDEIGDLLFVLVCLANSLGISMDETWKGLLAKLYGRDLNRWK